MESGESISLPTQLGYPGAWSPDSRRIAFQTNKKRTIKIVSLEDGAIEEIEVDLVDTNIYHLDWSPDGKNLVFAGYSGGGREFWMIEDFLPRELGK